LLRRELPPADVVVLELWQLARATRGGESASSRARALQRVRAFGRHCPRGLLKATRTDVAAAVDAQARRRGLTRKDYVRTTGHHLTVSALRSFYAHAAGLVHDLQNPLAGLMLLPRRSMAVHPSRRAARLFESVLTCPRLDTRTAAIVFLLASGFTPSEVGRLRAEDLDLAALTVTLRRRGACWCVPLTDRTIAALRNYVLERGVGRHGWLFQPSAGPSGIRTGYYGVRAAVRRAASAAFPHDAKLRSRITPIGFRQIYLARIVRSRLRPVAIAELTRFAEVKTIRVYGGPSTTATARRELQRIARRFPRWI
jgi:integrase